MVSRPRWGRCVNIRDSVSPDVRTGNGKRFVKVSISREPRQSEPLPTVLVPVRVSERRDLARDPAGLRIWSHWLPWAWSLGRTAIVVCVLLAGLGCKSVPKNDVSDILLPSNYREWSPEFAVLPTAEFLGDKVVLHNVRNATYVTETDFVLEYEDREYDLNDLEYVDFFVVPFQGFEFMAHTMISFGFKGDRYVAVSAEIRTEKGETYSPASGMARQFELTYVVADERDVVRLRTKHRNAEVYLYRTVATGAQSRQLFQDVFARVNELAQKPEFYHTITNNCTTNIVSHVNRIAPRKIAYNIGVLLPGYSDREAYNLGLLDRSVPFEQLKQEARINDLAAAFFDAPDFSAKIRRRLRNVEQPATQRLFPLAPEGLYDETERLEESPVSTVPDVARASFEEPIESRRESRAVSREPSVLTRGNRAPPSPPATGLRTILDLIPSERNR